MSILIKSIDINYFRSVYSVRLSNLKDLNILSGRNDVGKSNILKAMNLFFNGKTDWETSLDFYRDFSSQRLEQVRKESIKGKQFISIAIEFAPPQTYRRSLPQTVRVKRTWHRYGGGLTETNNLDSVYQRSRLPATLATARRFLPIFLNRVHFEYVPAVKDRRYYEHILTRLQKTLLDIKAESDTTISKTAGNLADHLQSKIARLQEDFKRATGIPSSIVPPLELSSLFRSFLVSTDSGEGHKVPLYLRGDGIQARYVNSVLYYIRENSNDFFVWGFEEPENSLEYSRSIEVANDFLSVYSKAAQMFLTTHSPAFTSLRTDDVTCFRVYQDAKALSHVGTVFPEEKSTEERAKLDVELGTLKIQEELHKKFMEQSETLKLAQNHLRDLEEEARQAQKPLVLVEGKHDRKILETAWQKLRVGVTCPFIFRTADPTGGITPGGAGGASALKMVIESVLPDERIKHIAVFDRDEKGLANYNSLSRNFRIWRDNPDIKTHVNGLAFATLLPIPPGRETYAEHKNLLIEFLFPDTALEMKNAQDHGLVFEMPETVVLVGKNRIHIDPNTLQVELPLESCRKIMTGKDIFANEIVPNLGAEHFQAFEQLFQTLELIISQ